MELEEATNVGDVKAGWEKTSLRPYVELFERHVEGILKEAREAKRGAFVSFLFGRERKLMMRGCRSRFDGVLGLGLVSLGGVRIAQWVQPAVQISFQTMTPRTFVAPILGSTLPGS